MSIGFIDSRSGSFEEVDEEDSTIAGMLSSSSSCGVDGEEERGGLVPSSATVVVIISPCKIAGQRDVWMMGKMKEYFNF
jgi:hypothetical protein